MIQDPVTEIVYDAAITVLMARFPGCTVAMGAPVATEIAERATRELRAAEKASK